jgi:ribosomal-protein-alanine N-acetyltransferase
VVLPSDKNREGQPVAVTQSKPAIEINELRYRPMNLEDIPRVHEIDQLSFSLPWPEKSFHFELTENPSTLALVAEMVLADSQPVVIGMSVVWIIIDEAHIATIAIHPDFRSRGYGRRLLVETLRRSIQRGAQLATLEVRIGNWIAQHMYGEFGFTVAGLRPHYYRDNNEDAVIMTVDKLGAKYLDWLNKLAL